MPKILINEKDNTSPGTPGSYNNYSVLIAGFAANTADLASKEIQPDSNGVYEFSSYQKFEDTIGLVAPETEQDINGNKVKTIHYGNQMAYELLKLGYPVIYKVLTEISELTKEDFWAVFKDKANYDFRFITHGLLESFKNASSESARLTKVNEAISKLDEIAESYVENDEITEEQFCNSEYNKIKSDFDGFKHPVTQAVYGTYTAAVEGTASEKDTLAANVAEISVTTADINKANKCIADLASYVTEENSTGDLAGRGDCIALLELDESTYVITSSKKPEALIIDAVNELVSAGIDDNNGAYCALTVPSVYYKMSIDKDDPNEFNNNTKFPGAFHYLACFKNSLNLGFAEWYAAAGYTRGVSSYVVDHASVKLGEIAINALEPRNYDDNAQATYPKFACNVIAYFRGSYYLWGNRTAKFIGKKGNLKNGDLVAQHFLNIRQLCTTIKKQLYVACRRFTFDPNSDTLWFNFVNAIKPTLEAMKADQGIRDYRILKITDDPKKATLKAKIRIIPIEAVEDFDLEVSLEDSFGETAAVVAE